MLQEGFWVHMNGRQSAVDRKADDRCTQERDGFSHGLMSLDSLVDWLIMG